MRAKGLARYIAVALLAGDFWLAMAAALALANAGLWPGNAAYDAALNALALGAFVIGSACAVWRGRHRAAWRSAVAFAPRKPH